jgi:hypothetical protein
MKKIFYRLISIAAGVAFLLQVASCGTLLYPKRRGQKSGQVDVAVVLMDAIGLFFFIIPGVIAFAVDFSTGAIYLPKGKSRRANNGPEGDLHVIRMDPKKMDRDAIARSVEVYTGQPVRFDDNSMVVVQSEEDLDIKQELFKLEAAHGIL